MPSKLASAQSLIGSGSATSRGIQALVRSGDPGLGTIVMVHGTLDRAGSFNRLARRIEGPRLVAYDRRGYQSSRELEGARSMDDHIADLVDVVGELRGDGPVALVGHSFGGVVTMAAAIAEPSLADVVVTYEPPTPWLWIEPHPHRGMRPEADPAQAVEGFFRHMVSDAAWERMTEAERDERRLDGGGVISDMTIIRMETPFDLDDLAGLEAQLTIGLGISSPGHLAAAERIVAAAPHARIERIEGAGHGAHLSHPDHLSAIVERAVARP